jgi:hypothetical protein
MCGWVDILKVITKLIPLPSSYLLISSFDLQRCFFYQAACYFTQAAVFCQAVLTIKQLPLKICSFFPTALFVKLFYLPKLLITIKIFTNCCMLKSECEHGPLWCG